MNRYRIKQSLGNGRLGHVYLAEDLELSRDVIVREFDVSQNEDIVVFGRQFRSLVADLASINDENVLPVLDSGIEENTAYIVGNPPEGDTVRNLLGRNIFNIIDVYDMAKQLLVALEKFSSIGFFHYHFRLSSVLVQNKPEGGKHFLLMDMGYGKLIPMIHGVGAELGMICPVFAAPELCSGQPKGEITSLFMIGQLCYTMLADCHPMVGLPLATAKAKHMVGEMPYLSGYRADIPEGFKDWIYKLMNPNWNERPQSIAAALEILPMEEELESSLSYGALAPRPISRRSNT